MKVIDVHVHHRLVAGARETRQWLEESAFDIAHVFSIHPFELPDGGRDNIEKLADLAREIPDRIRPLAFIDPLHPDAPKITEWAVRECGMMGLKMIPRYWYPDDDRAKEVYRVAGDLGVPIQFHCGILWLPGDTSKYSQPAGFEVMWEFPKVRFSLAHVGWPWVDECIAVLQKFKVLNRDDPSRHPRQAMVDLTPGTPLIYRKEALRKCLACTGVDFFMFGSDSGLPVKPLIQSKLQTDIDLLREIGCTPEDMEKILWKNAEEFLRPSDGA